MPAARANKTDPLPVRPKADDGAALIAIVLAGFYLLLIIAGGIIFHGPNVMVGGNEMSLPRAWFTSINAVTLTGFRQSVALDQLLPLGRICTTVLMTGGAFITMSIASLAVVKILRLRWNPWQIMLAAIVAQLLGAIVGGAMMLGGGRDVSSAMFQASSAFDNFGLALGNLPSPRDPRTLLVLLPLSVLGGVGLPVLLELFAYFFLGRAQNKFSSHTRIVLLMTSLVFLAGVLLSILLTWSSDAKIVSTNDTLASDLIATVNARGAGFGIEAVYSYPRALQWLIMLLMAIGAASAGTGGGIKITTLFAVFRGGDRAIKGQNPGTLFGIALSWIGIYFACVFLAQLWMLRAQPELPADRALFVTISAMSNVGLSHDPLSVSIDNSPVLCITMLLGRLLPMAVLWWTVANVSDADVAVA